MDTNVALSFFLKKSVTRTLFDESQLDLCSPEFMLEEINKLKSEIKRKFKLSEAAFKEARRELALIEFIPEKEYRGYVRSALRITPDKDDVDFFALALKEKCPLWSNDKLLKEQKAVIVFSTEDVIRALDKLE